MTFSHGLSLDRFTATERPLFEDAMALYVTPSTGDSRELLQEAMAYSLLAPAKRFRPMVCLATYKLFEDALAPIYPLASALEMIHCYSLIHDDLPDMDNDDYRRGRLTCHKVYGNDIAILAGDTLNSYAVEILAKDLPKHFPADRVLRVIQDFTYACGIHGLAGGQALDLRPIPHPTPAHLENIHRRKTGALIRASVTLPTQLACDDASVQSTLTAFGESIGLLFQIVDDILDVTENSETLGKTANKDQEQGKVTFVALYGLDKANLMKDQEGDKARALLDSLKGYDTALLNELVSYIQRRNH